MPRLEVRCCCQPHKLLGWLNVPDDSRPEAAFLIPASPSRLSRRYLSTPPAPMASKLIRLPIAEISVGINRYKALKSEDTPIEMLRKIPGFIENR